MSASALPSASRGAPLAGAPMSQREPASPLPLIVGGAAVALSAGIAVLVVVGFSAEVAPLGVGLPLVRTDSWWLSFLGYLLTPIVVIACYGWNAVAQRNGLRRNPQGFVVRPTYSTALRWAVGVGILLGAWHALNLSVPLSEVLL